MLSRPLAVVPAVLTGLLAGGMVLIEVVLLPFWRGTSAADFRDWFTAHSGRMRDLMVPLGAGAGTVGAASAVTHLAEGAQALSRATGGGTGEEPDADSMTGTGDSEPFVGRVAGQDVGYAGETGAERRAAAQQED